MADKLAARAEQVREDMEDLLRAGANDLGVSGVGTDGGEVGVLTDKSARWVAATLLSRAFNLEVPLHETLTNGACPDLPSF
jgi:hypothetical protein